MEADDLGIYVCKFRGAGQGLNGCWSPRSWSPGSHGLLDVPVTPRLVEVDLSEPRSRRYEADEEVQDLLTASLGSNLGVDFLPGSFGFDTSVEVDPAWAGRVLWLDAYVANVDRSWRNPNLLLWHARPWLIDHGASLYFAHSWSGGVGSADRFAAQAWDLGDHVLARYADQAPALDAELAAAVTDDVLREVLDAVPDEWLVAAPDLSPGELREAYVAFLRARRDGARGWLPGRAS